MDGNQCLLKIEGVSKSFPGVQALSDLDMEVNRGEILALVGENGAGKSTLIKILSGVYRPESGRILLDGKEASFRNPREAEQAGISVVYQELSLVPNLSVAENVYGGRPLTNAAGLIDTRAMNRFTAEMLGRFEAQFSPETRVGLLSLGNQQLVEIIKSLSWNAKILILDEPTSSLSLQEANILFERLRQLKEQGITIVYVSHHLEEVFAISDRITVMRDGKYVGTKITEQTKEEEIVSMMVGHELGGVESLTAAGEHGAEFLRLQSFSRKKIFEDISFSLYSGEILTFFGLVGAGRTEVARALIGLDSATGGKVFVKGKEVRINQPGDAMRKGIAYLSEDRKTEGLFLDKSIKENFLATNLSQVAPNGWLNWRTLNELVEKFIKLLEIRTPDSDRKVTNLSGGNQQKVLLGEWLAIGPDILIVDEPTRGIDVGTKQEIHRLLRELADQGKAVMVISSDLPEALRISDRIAVMRRGRIVDILPHSEVSEERIMQLAASANVGANKFQPGMEAISV